MTFITFTANTASKTPNSYINEAWKEAASLERQADEAFIRFQHTTAINLYQQAIKKKEEAVGKDCLTIARTYTKLGNVFESLENHSEAFKVYVAALYVNLHLEPYEKESDQRIMDLFVKIGYCYEKAGLLENAITNYKEAVKFYEKQANPNNQSFLCKKMVKIYQNNICFFCKKIAKAYLSLGNHAAALEWLNKSVELPLETDKDRRNTLALIRYCSKTIDLQSRQIKTISSPPPKRICIKLIFD